jgi:hypothetical protein
MGYRVASYFRHGRTMSRRAIKAHNNNEHPLTHWMKILGLEKETIKSMFPYCGIHHTGLYAKRTGFYRLPNLKNEKEFRKFYNVFRSIPAGKKKCIDYFSEWLQEKVNCKPAVNRIVYLDSNGQRIRML